MTTPQRQREKKVTAKIARERHLMVCKIQELQSTAHNCGLPLTAQALNRAMNVSGWEQCGETDIAIKAMAGVRP